MYVLYPVFRDKVPISGDQKNTEMTFTQRFSVNVREFTKKTYNLSVIYIFIVFRLAFPLIPLFFLAVPS